MMLVLSGMPPDMPVAVLRNMIQQSCDVNYVLLEEQERCSPNDPRSVTVGCQDEISGHRILQRLNGVMLGPHRLYVAPFAFQNQLQKQCYMDEDDPMTGLSKVPPWKQQSQDWQTRRSEAHRSPQELSSAASALLPPYGAAPPLMQTTLSKVPPWFQARPLSPVRERSPVRIWDKNLYTRRGPSPDRRGRDSNLRGSRRHGPDLGDSLVDRRGQRDRVDANSNRNDASKVFSKKALKRAAQLERQPPHPSYTSPRGPGAAKAIPSLLEPLGSLPVPKRPIPSLVQPLRTLGAPQRYVPQASFQKTLGRNSGTRYEPLSSGFRADLRSNGKGGHHQDLARRPADLRKPAIGANPRSAPKGAATPRHEAPKKKPQPLTPAGMAYVEKRAIEALFNSRPQSGTGVKPKYIELMKALVAEVRTRLSSIRGDVSDAQSMYQLYCKTYNPIDNRKTKLKGILLLAARALEHEDVVVLVAQVQMETPWVSPVAPEGGSAEQRKFQVNRLLNEAAELVCHVWLKPPDMDARQFLQELARLNSADTSNKASSGVLTSEDLIVFDRLKLMTFRGLQAQVAKQHDILDLTPEEVAQIHMTKMSGKRDDHLKASIGYCKHLRPAYSGVFSRLFPESKKEKKEKATNNENTDRAAASGLITRNIMKENKLSSKVVYQRVRRHVIARMTEMEEELGECDMHKLVTLYAERYHDGADLVRTDLDTRRDELPAPDESNARDEQPAVNNGDARVAAAQKSMAKSADVGGVVIKIEDDETGDRMEPPTRVVETADSEALKQSKLRRLLAAASEIVSKPCDMGVVRFIQQLSRLKSDAPSPDAGNEVSPGRLSTADAAVYKHLKGLTLRELHALADAGQEMLNLSPKQIAQAYLEKFGDKVQEHLKCAIEYSEGLHGPYRGIYSDFNKSDKLRNAAPPDVLALVTVRACKMIMKDTKLKPQRFSHATAKIYAKLRQRVKPRMKAIQDQLEKAEKTNQSAIMKRYRELYSDNEEVLKYATTTGPVASDINIDEIEMNAEDLEDF